MADEVYEAVTGETREYTNKAYQQMRILILEKVKFLNKYEINFWNAQNISKALWAAGMIKLFEKNKKSMTSKSTADHQNNLISGTSSLSSTKKRKRS